MPNIYSQVNYLKSILSLNKRHEKNDWLLKMLKKIMYLLVWGLNFWVTICYAADHKFDLCIRRTIELSDKPILKFDFPFQRILANTTYKYMDKA